MWDLSKHERLEIEILNGLNSRKILENLIFCGGTMLRLCHELNRYSVDLDFWLVDPSIKFRVNGEPFGLSINSRSNPEFIEGFDKLRTPRRAPSKVEARSPEERSDEGRSRTIDISKEKEVYKEIHKYLEENYKLKTAVNKHTSLIFEFGSKDYIRNLKIEIRKAQRNIKYEEKIAFSRHSNIQVLIKAATLEEMMKAKVETFLDRVRIRDVFDIEFLLRRGIKIEASKAQLKEMQKLIRHFRAKDYKITLGSLLEFKDRQYYKTANFRCLLDHIKTALEVDQQTLSS